MYYISFWKDIKNGKPYKYNLLFNKSYKQFIRRTLNPRQSSHAPGSADLLTSSWHLHEAVDKLLCILEKKSNKQ